MKNTSSVPIKPFLAEAASSKSRTSTYLLPTRHVLTMAVGVSDQLRVHSYQPQPSPGVQLLWSTDGLHGVPSQQQIEKTLASNSSLEAKCRQLIASARAQGGPDNITAVLLQTS